ncbi:MAG: Gldg family protein [Leptonema sp. (in: bacteria)]
MKSFNKIFQSREFIIINLIILFILINLIGYNLNLRLDLTKEKINSVSQSTYKVLQKLKIPLLIEAYVSKDIPGQILSQLQPIFYQLEDVKRIGGDKITLKIIDPTTEELKNLATKRGIQGIPIEEADINKASVRLGYFGIYLQYGDKTSTISLVEQGGIVGNFEYILLKEIKKLTLDREKKSGIGYAKVEGTLEFRRWQTRLDMDKDNLYAFKNFIERELGTIQEISLNEPIPDTIETLMIVGLPKFSRKQQVYLDQFLMRGGNLLFMLKGFDFTITPPNPQLLQMGISSGTGGYVNFPEEVDRINEFLNRYGFEIKKRVLLEPTLAAPELDVLGQYFGKYPNPSWSIYSHEYQNINKTEEIIKDISYVIFPWFSDIQFNPNVQPNVSYKVLIHTSKNVIEKKEIALNLKELQSILKNQEASLNQNLPVMVFAKGKFVSGFKEDYENNQLDEISENLKQNFIKGQIGNTEGKILILGTPYLVSDIFFRNEGNLEYFKINMVFISNILEYLQGDLDLLAVRSKISTVPFLKVNLGQGLELIFSWFHTLFIPVVLGFYGFIRLKKRYRKQGVEE